MTEDQARALHEWAQATGQLTTTSPFCANKPFSFTREDVEALREAYVPLGRYVHFDFDDLADRIAALLPPEEKP